MPRNVISHLASGPPINGRLRPPQSYPMNPSQDKMQQTEHLLYMLARGHQLHHSREITAASRTQRATATERLLRSRVTKLEGTVKSLELNAYCMEIWTLWFQSTFGAYCPARYGGPLSGGCHVLWTNTNCTGYRHLRYPSAK